MATFRPTGPTAASTVREKRMRALGWAPALSELIDNSVGNGATQVDVEVTKKTVTVKDNGVGCTPEMFAALVSLGWHQDDALTGNTVSRYGIGAKDAMLWFGGPTTCVSKRDGLCLWTKVNWDDFQEEWSYEDPIENGIAIIEADKFGISESGVIVHAPEHNRQIQAGKAQQIFRTLAAYFWAAVETGVVINVKFLTGKNKGERVGGQLPGKPMPELLPDANIDDTFELEDGRTIRIVGGVLSPSVRTSAPGFEYIYGHRVVIEACGIGAGPCDYERFYARVFLLGNKEDWDVTTNKTGIHDTDEVALAQAVYDRCRDLLIAATSEAVTQLHDDDLMREVSDALTVANRKHAKRRPPINKTGTVEPTGDGAEHEEASEVHSEPRKGKYRKKGEGGNMEREGIAVKVIEFEDEAAHLYGKAFIRDRVVRLNKRHPAVDKAINDKDKIALKMMAWSLWSDAWIWQDSNGQRRMTESGDFVAKMSAMLRTNGDD